MIKRLRLRIKRHFGERQQNSSFTSARPKLIKGISAKVEFTNNKAENDIDSFEKKSESKITSVLSK